MWVQVQQRDCRHDLCAEANTGEMQRAGHRSICKAFDAISYNGLWKILACLGCPP